MHMCVVPLISLRFLWGDGMIQSVLQVQCCAESDQWCLDDSQTNHVFICAFPCVLACPETAEFSPVFWSGL